MGVWAHLNPCGTIKTMFSSVGNYWASSKLWNNKECSTLNDVYSILDGRINVCTALLYLFIRPINTFQRFIGEFSCSPCAWRDHEWQCAFSPFYPSHPLTASLAANQACLPASLPPCLPTVGGSCSWQIQGEQSSLPSPHNAHEASAGWQTNTRHSHARKMYSHSCRHKIMSVSTHQPT